MEELKVRTIVKNISALTAISRLKLSMNVSFKIAKFLNEAQTVLDMYSKRSEELRKELLPEEKKGKKTNEKVKKEAEETLIKELDKLLDEKLEIVVPELKLSDFGNAEIEPNILMSLDWLISE